jgi:ERCC4-type nuclease
MIKALMIDDREPQHIQDLKFKGASKFVTRLDYGDVWATCGDGAMLCIERKAPNDFLGSLKDGRVFVQCNGIRSKTPWAYLVISGLLTPDVMGKTIADGRSTGWDWASVQGALLSIQELGCGVVHTNADADFEQTVLRLASRDRGEQVLAPKVDARMMTPGEQILTALPGIGWERARQILTYFEGHTAEALAWLTWTGNIGEIHGIGPATKRSIRKALSLRDDEDLYCWNNETSEFNIKHHRGARIGALPVDNNQTKEEEGLLVWT